MAKRLDAALAPGGSERMLDDRIVWTVAAVVVAGIVGAAFVFGIVKGIGGYHGRAS